MAAVRGGERGRAGSIHTGVNEGWWVGFTLWRNNGFNTTPSGWMPAPPQDVLNYTHVVWIACGHSVGPCELLVNPRQLIHHSPPGRAQTRGETLWTTCASRYMAPDIHRRLGIEKRQKFLCDSVLPACRIKKGGHPLGCPPHDSRRRGAYTAPCPRSPAGAAPGVGVASSEAPPSARLASAAS